MFKMKKVLPMLLICAGILSGCGQKQEQAGSNIDVKEVFEVSKEADTTLPEMTTVSSEDDNAEVNFTLLCDFDYDRVSSYYYAYASDGTAPELAVVCLKDRGDAAGLMKKLKDHAEDRKGAMREYSPDQVEAVEKYALVREGAVVLYAIGEKNGLSSEAFKKAVGEE